MDLWTGRAEGPPRPLSPRFISESQTVLTTSEAYDDAALAALIASAVLLGADLKAGLYTNVIDPTKRLVIADMTEPLYASYLRQSIVMGAIFRDPQRGIAALGAGVIWQMTGTPTPTTVQGIFYTFGAGPAFLGIEPFPAPISLVDDLDAFTTVLEYVQSQQFAGFTTVVQ